MKSRIWMLELGRTHWRLHAIGDDALPPVEREFDAADLVVQAEPVRETLTANGYADDPIILALDSNWCLATTLDVNRPQELRDRQTLLYRLEEWMPWSVDDCVCDFIAAGKQALMVAVQSNPIAEFLNRMELLGVGVQSIIPTALLATAAHTDGGEWPARYVVAFENNGWIDLVSIDTKTPVGWLHIPTDISAISQELTHRALDTGQPSQLISYGLSDLVRSKLQVFESVQLLESDPPAATSRMELALLAAEKILRGHCETPIELKRGAFGRTRGNIALHRYSLALQCAVAVMLFSVAAVLLYRGYLAARNTALLTVRQAEVFKSLFPSTKVPTGIRNRLESELSKLRGLQGEDSSLPSTLPVPLLLHRLFAALPEDRRFRLLEIRIEDGRLYLDGEVRDHSDAEAIAQRLRSQGFEIPPPPTQRLDDKRVSLRITGRLSPTGTLALKKLK
jgi:type II secretory pathway component PulL